MLLVAACGSSEDPVDELPQDVDVLLATSAEAMGTVQTVRFEIERGGVPVYIDTTGTLEFKDATGRFVAPQAADAVVKVGVSGLNVQIGAIAIEGTVWLSNPISGEWEQAPSSYAFDPTQLFDPDIGWRPLLADELQNATFVGRKQIEGEERFHLTGSAPAARIETITAGLVSNQDVDLDLYLDPETGHVLEVAFDATTAAGVSTWDLRFFGYGDDIEIVPPDELNASG
jgi:lipoprotein LprG